MYNVLIRPLREQDALTSYNWRNDPVIWENTGRKPDRHITGQIETEWIRKVLAEGNSSRFAILADNTYIGNIQITNILPGEEGEYHVFIGEKNYWGKGIATLATWQLIRYAREGLNLKRLYLSVKPHNEAAVRVYQKCGFVKVSEEIKMVCDLSAVQIPTVSVFMMAYNHEDYIRQSVESILYQKTDFDFDIVIGEDCSTDNTRSVLKTITDEYPGKFRLLLHEKNMGPHANQLAVFNACTGKYVAMCECDDYWIDPLKLKKQADYLEKHPETGMVCTNYQKYYQNAGKYINNCFNSKKYRSQVAFSDYLLDMSSISTATVLIRNDIIRQYGTEIPEILRNGFIVGDTPLWLFAAAKSHIAVIPDETAVYRILDNSACHFRSPEDHYKFVLKGSKMADYFYDRYGGNDPVLLERVERKKHKAALFHGYRSMNSIMAGESFRKLMTYGLSVKQKISAWLMLIGSYNKLLNRIAGVIIKVNKPALTR